MLHCIQKAGRVSDGGFVDAFVDVACKCKAKGLAVIVLVIGDASLVETKPYGGNLHVENIAMLANPSECRVPAAPMTWFSLSTIASTVRIGVSLYLVLVPKNVQ